MWSTTIDFQLEETDMRNCKNDMNVIGIFFS